MKVYRREFDITASSLRGVRRTFNASWDRDTALSIAEAFNRRENREGRNVIWTIRQEAEART